MIKVKNVYKRFGIKNVLCGINFDISSKEIVVILGSSGIGKSVLLKIIVGLLKPDAGTVEIDNINITKCSTFDLQRIRRKIGYVFQEAALFDSLTVYENIAFGLKMFTTFTEDEIKFRVIECLKIVNLEGIEHLKPYELSGGMKKRTALARAIAYNPNYVLCDEPTMGLDIVMIHKINKLIIDLKKKGITSIVVTHDIKSAYEIADRILLLYDGKIIFNGTPLAIKYYENDYIKKLIKYSQIYEKYDK
ncbi:MAG: ATP-binding cassette domain-containing protein [Endomicrobium sp.]|jgi:phospholipid/cholesterol/gamma-HCH transport system ATP-binding protein|nr:ATP-binding cassette domain-containing protein [Endomicrobium sp.]